MEAINVSSSEQAIRFLGSASQIEKHIIERLLDVVRVQITVEVIDRWTELRLGREIDTADASCRGIIRDQVGKPFGSVPAPVETR